MRGKYTENPAVIDARLRHELERFNPETPLRKASTPPASWYVDCELFEWEQARVLRSNWVIAARAEQVDTPGKFVCGTRAGERYVIIRGEDNKLRAFYNVCRHHAAAVMQGEGTTKRLTCPYHGWTYGLDGRLINAPELGDIDDFDPQCSGLVPMAVETWGPFVFISMGEHPRDLSDDLKELQTALEATRYESLRFVRRVSYTIECNWKIYVDNYLDGGYHVAYLHRGLAAQLDLASYRTELFNRFSIQTTDGLSPSKPDTVDIETLDPGTDFRSRIGGRAVYAWIHPNLMINRYGNIMDTNWVIPLSPSRTEVIFDYYFLETDGDDAAQFIEQSIAASDVVQQEDMEICEAVQRGLESRSYDRGRYSAKLEMGEHHFHRLLAHDFESSLR